MEIKIHCTFQNELSIVKKPKEILELCNLVLRRVGTERDLKNFKSSIIRVADETKFSEKTPSIPTMFQKTW